MATISWKNPISDLFSVAADWSSGTVPGAADTAVLGGLSGAAYTVSSTAAQTIAAIQTAVNATLSITGSTFTASNGTGGGLNAGTISIGDNGTFVTGGTFANSGSVSLSSYNAARFIAGTNTTLTGGGQVTLQEGTYAASNAVYGATAATMLTNVDNVISGAGQLGAGQLTLINQASGVINANAASHQLVLNTGSAVVSNAGLIEATGAAGLLITGTKVDDSTGGVLLANNSTIDLQSATIVSGSLKTSGTGTFQTTDRGSMLDGTSKTSKLYVLGTVDIAGNGTSLTINGTINLTQKVGAVTTNGVISLTSYNASQLIAGTKNATLVGSQVLMNDGTYGASNQIIGIQTPGKSPKDSALNNQSTISGAGTIGTNLILTNSSKGVIDATGGSHALVLATGSANVAKSNVVKNSGLIESTNPTAAASVGGLTISNTVISNSGATAVIQANGAATHVDLQTATIVGGTLKTLAGGVIQTVDGGSILDGSTAIINNQATIVIAASTALSLKGAINNTGVFSITSYNPSRLIAAANTTLTGGGAVTLNEGQYAYSNQVYGATGATTLTNVNNTISGAGQLGAGQLTLVNQAAGVINATGSTNQLVINTGAVAVTNAGLIEATGAAGLRITSTTIANAATGLVEAVGSHIDLASATIAGGTLVSSAGGYFDTTDTGSILDGSTATVNNQATITIANSTALSLKGAINNTGVFSITSYNPSQLIAAANTTLTGGGAVTLNEGQYAYSNQVYGATGATTLTNVDNIISGAGQIGAGQLTLINDAAGVINATGGTNQLVINTGAVAVTNAGLIEATGAAGLRITSTTIANAATGLVEAIGSHIDLASATIAGGTLVSSAGGYFDTTDAGSILDGSSATVNNQASIVIANSTALSLKGAINNTGTISITSYNPSRLIAAANTTLTGGGAVTLNEGQYAYSNQVYGATGATSLTNVDNTISGAGQLGAGQLTLVNQAAGVINATGSTNQLVINTGSVTITNAGLIEATASAGLTISSAVANSGTLSANGGNVVASGAISGAGTDSINGSSVFEAGAADSNTVSFAAASTGKLKLDQSQLFTGTVTGLSTGKTIDLANIAIGTATLTYTGTTTSGTLKVTDGSLTATIKLTGKYTKANFHLANDGSGHVNVTYTGTGMSPTPGVAQMSSAMAAMGGGGGGHSAVMAGSHTLTPSLLSLPHAA